MKICTHCKNAKPLELFAKRSASSDGYAFWCKQCFAEKAATKYQESAAERQRKKTNRANQALANQSKIKEYFQNRSCEDCESKDWRVFEFDHRDPSMKEFNVSNMYRSYSWENILKELEKCDVVCANCHKLRTWKMFGFWRL